MTVKLLTEHHLKFLSLKGGCTGSSESTLVKMPHCWKSHVKAHLSLRSLFCLFLSGRFTPVLLYAHKPPLNTILTYQVGLDVKLFNGLSLYLHRYFEYTSSEGSGESVHSHRLN